MSSVDGAKSVLQESDEVLLYQCGPCENGGRNTGACHFCENCREYLCKTCRDSHLLFKMSKDHSVLSGTDMPKRASVFKKSGIGEFCSCNQNQEVTMYCVDHDDVICSSCKTITHRNCKTATIAEKSATYTLTKLNSILTKAKDMKAKFKMLHKQCTADRLSLERAKETCKREINTFRKELNSILDKLEATVLADLDQNESKLQPSMRRHAETLSTTMNLLNKDCKTIEDAKEDGRKKRMFASEVKVTKRLQDYEAVFQDIQKETVPTDLNFERNAKLADLHRNIETFGTIKVTTVCHGQPAKKSMLDMKVQASKQVKIRSPGDEETPCITGCAFMPNGELVLCDRKNKKIKLVDHSWTVKSNIPLPTGPRDVSVVDDQNIIVTFPDTKQLQYIQVFPQMKAQQIIRLDKQCWGIEVFGNEIYVTCHTLKSDGEVRVLDLSGNIKRTIGINKDGTFMFRSPYYLTINKHSRKLYVSDCGSSALLCLTLDENLVYRFGDKDSDYNNGVYVDEGNNVFVCVEYSNNVQVVNKKGELHKRIITSQDGINNPHCIDVRTSDDILVIGCWYSGNLFTFKLAK